MECCGRLGTVSETKGLNVGEVGAILITVIVLLIAVPALVVAAIFLAGPVFRGIGWLIRHVFSFIKSTLLDLLKLFGALLTSLVLVPLTIVNVLIGRWSSSAHYGRAIEAELKAAVGCLYRIVIGNPARLLLLSPLTEGIEKRVPAAMAHAPGADRPSKRQGQFDGYTIVGSLPGGGSGSRLFVAEPTAQKLAALARSGQRDVDRVVIKSFSLADGSTLPQIVRENRALPAAKRLGLILEHELTEDRFYYVTRYVPGESLTLAMQRLHAITGGSGLSGRHLIEGIGYAADILRTLHTYHSGGLWHKDVKPDNVIVSDGQAHLVDFGLVTPLRSSMTLTTHGTEYFRDPEMVRMALRGVKVHEVDGAKFDIYAAGAVLYSIIENSFPAHGGLSQISRPCPEAIRWIIRRAMADYDKRYDSVSTMLLDLETVLGASDPLAVRPVDLPSMRAGGDAMPYVPSYTPDLDEIGAARVGTPASVGPRFAAASAAPPVFAGATLGAGTRPALKVSSWWTGRYELAPAAASAGVAMPAPVVAAPDRVPGLTAAEQLSRARQRARDARARAYGRLKSRRADGPGAPNAGVFFALLVLVVGTALFLLSRFVPNVFRSASNIAQYMPTGVSVPDPDSASSQEWDSADFSQLPITIADAPAAPAGPIPPPMPQLSGAGSTDRIAQSGVQIDHAAQSAIEVKSTRPDRNRTDRPAAAVKGEGAAMLPPAPPARVFVLKHNMTLSATQQELIDARLSRLSKAGYGLIGLAAPSPDNDPTIVERETTMSAELRTVIGMSPFKSPPAADAIRAWLDQQPSVDVVLWIDQDDQAEASMWLIPRRDLPASRTEALRERLTSSRSPEIKSKP